MSMNECISLKTNEKWDVYVDVISRNEYDINYWEWSTNGERNCMMN